MSKSVIRGFPLLKYTGDKTTITGSIIVAEGDEYDIKIELRGFPKGIPAVYETEGRIPWKADRHAYDDGRLCLTTETNMEIYLTSEVKTIENLIELLVVPYLQNNSYYELNQKYKFDEYAHSAIVSTYETYRDLLGVEDIPLLIKVTGQRLKVRPNEKCYCGSNSKIKNCSDHYDRYKKFRLISQEQLVRDEKALRMFMQAILQYQKGRNILHGLH